MNEKLPHDHKRRFAEFQDEDRTMPPPVLSTVRLLFADKHEESNGSHNDYYYNNNNNNNNNSNNNGITGIYNLDFPSNNQLAFEQQIRNKLESQLLLQEHPPPLGRILHESELEFRANPDNYSSNSIRSDNNNNKNIDLETTTTDGGHILHSNSYSGLLGSNKNQSIINTSRDNSISSNTSENEIKLSSKSQSTGDSGNSYSLSIKRARRRIIRNSLGSPQRLSRIELVLQQQQQLEHKAQLKDGSIDDPYQQYQLTYPLYLSTNHANKEEFMNSHSSLQQNNSNTDPHLHTIEASHKRDSVNHDSQTHLNSKLQDNDSEKSSLFWMSVEKNRSNSLISISEEKHNELRKRIEERKRMDELKELFKKENHVDMQIDQENKNGSSRGSSGEKAADPNERVPLSIIPGTLLNQVNDVFKRPKSKIPISASMNAPPKAQLQFPANFNSHSSQQYPMPNAVPLTMGKPVSHNNNNMGKILQGTGKSLNLTQFEPIQTTDANNDIRAPSSPNPPAQQATNENSNSKKKALTINGVIYEKLQLIGRGGTSKVYKVLAPNNRHYAIKKVTFDQFDEGSVRGFKGEIDLLKKLKESERVVKLIDYDVRDGLIYLVMECGDLDLATVFQNRLKKLDLEFVKYHAIEIFKCVLAVHDNGIVHSDLKPANFLFVKGMLKIIDFGIANAVPDHTSNIYRESQIGTPNYMAPEALVETNLTSQQVSKNTWRVGRPSDVWSCGCIIYQMIYGKPPYGAYTGNQRIMAIMNPQVKIQFHSKGIGDAKVPQTAIRLMRKCLARDPLERWTVEQCLKSDFLHPKVVTESFVRDLVHLSINFGHSSRVNGGVISADVYDQVVETVLKQIEELNY